MSSGQILDRLPRRESSRTQFIGKARLLRLCAGVLIGLVCALFVFPVGSHAASAVAKAQVDTVVLNGEINAASQHFLTGAITTAEHDGAQALVIQINTPGGDIAAMQAIISAELSSTVPIISYISPSGSYAASAGAFVALAAHVAAMAPSTTIGASSPVNGDGSDLAATEKAKVESVLTTDMTNIQQRYKRQVAPAVNMIIKATSYGDQQAMDLGIIDLRASNFNDLLARLDGRLVILADGQSVILHTANASIQDLNPSVLDNLYALLIDPNVIFLLFLVAMIGIFIEISHPGAIVPGVTGSIALLLFLFSAGTLSPNWAGLALMVLALVLLILDVRLPTHGVLTIGAVISLIVGALLFFNTGGPYQGAQVHPLLIYGAGLLVGLVGLYVAVVILRLQQKPVSLTGVEGMIGRRVTALTPLEPEGRVSYGGEDWSAILDPPAVTVDAGSELYIVSVEGLHLRVQLVSDALPPLQAKQITRA